MSTTTTYQAKTESGPERGPRGTSGPALRGRDLSAPRTGNTGGKLTTLSPSFAHCERSLSIHWLRVTHPMSAMRILRASLVRLFGEPDEIRGRWFYEHGERFANGILLLWGETVNADQDGDPSEHALCIDVPGGALDALDFYDRFNLCQQLSLGGRVTRLDIALDCQACTGTVGLIDRIINACDTGCMVGARRWKTISESNGGERSGYGVSIGLRGSKGSGRFLRAYDKGLESGEAPEGIWERYEVEFTGDSAAEVGADIFRAIGTHEDRAFERVAGAFDYRHNPESAHGHRDRRPRMEWWSDFLGGAKPHATHPKRERTNLERYTNWIREQVLPLVARLSVEGGLHWTEVMFTLIGEDVEPRGTDKHTRTLIREYLEEVLGRGEPEGVCS